MAKQQMPLALEFQACSIDLQVQIKKLSLYVPALKIILSGICENSLKLQEAIEGLLELSEGF